MLKKVQTDTSRRDFAVSLDGVVKIFSQWQRDNTRKGMLRNLIKPEKRIITALDDVSLDIKKGEFAAYAGPNGAGKSTTMKLLAGMIAPTSGNISVIGMRPDKDRIAVMKKIGVLFGNRTELWWDHPLIQSFEWKKVVWDIPDEQYENNLKTLTGLLEIGGLMKTFARELSLGQRMRADLVMAMLHSPELILLDEPTLGLDVSAKRSMIGFLKEINRQNGVTIVVTSHDMDDLEEMARRVIMVSNGKIAFDGSFDELRGVAGKRTRIAVAMEDGQKPPIKGARLISEENGVFEYEADLSETPVKSVLEQLSKTDRIKDIEIKKAPIEQVIADLYEVWKRQPAEL